MPTTPAVALKAYTVSHINDDGCFLVFAPTHGKAKSLGYGAYCAFNDTEWIDLRCRRCPASDQYAREFGESSLSGEAPEQARVMRNLGWHEINGYLSPCESCGLHEWEAIPESHIAEEYGDCLECQGIAP